MVCHTLDGLFLCSKKYKGLTHTTTRTDRENIMLRKKTFHRLFCRDSISRKYLWDFVCKIVETHQEAGGRGGGRRKEEEKEEEEKSVLLHNCLKKKVPRFWARPTDALTNVQRCSWQ